MITKQDLQAAIAECTGQRNPDARTCIKLAAFLTIQEHLYGELPSEPSYSYAVGNIEYSGDSDFARAIQGKDTSFIMSVMDEMMTAVRVLSPRLYDSVLRKIREG